MKLHSINVFRAETRILDSGSAALTIGGTLRLPLPPDCIRTAGQIRIVINAEKIVMRKNGAGVSVTVRQMEEEKDKIRMVVDAGVPIVLYMSREIYHSQATMVGDQVGLQFPPGAIRIL